VISYLDNPIQMQQVSKQFYSKFVPAGMKDGESSIVPTFWWL
jgi:hypothetical protein